ncbi:MAG: energy-coupling factor transporter transmembrane protein EcfT [Thermoproteales archaeon]|nr:energy-coupling factor transporter transmembrane protein EcfT [Thermoproteales archaeon]
MVRLGQYVERDSWMHRLDGRSKLIFSFSLMICGLLIENIVILTSIILFTILLSFSAKIGREFLKSLKGIFYLVLFAGLIWLLFYRTSLFLGKSENVTVIARYGPFTIDSLGLIYAIRMPLRILIAISIPTLYFMTTTIREFIISLVKLKIPYVIAFTFGLAAQLIFSLGDEFEKIKEAQTARGLSIDEGSLVKRVKNHIPIIVPFTVRSLDLVEQINIALNLKHFNPKKKSLFYKEKSFGINDWIVVVISLFTLFFSISLSLGIYPRFF